MTTLLLTLQPRICWREGKWHQLNLHMSRDRVAQSAGSDAHRSTGDRTSGYRRATE